jgi:hypothetical protein
MRGYTGLREFRRQEIGLQQDLLSRPDEGGDSSQEADPALHRGRHSAFIIVIAFYYSNPAHSPPSVMGA